MRTRLASYIDAPGTWGVIIAAMIALVSGSASAEPTLEIIGDQVYALSLSADGTVVAGNTFGVYETFRWTQATGVVPLGRSTVGVLGTGAGTPDVSADGTRISATILGADMTYGTQGLWDLQTGWRETMPPTPPDGGLIDNFYGSAWGLSGDGNTLVGLYWRPGQAATGLAHPCYWTEATGVVDLGTAGGNGRANAASFDGSVIVGWEEAPFGNWMPTVWVDGVRSNLSTDDSFHEAGCVNDDGTIVGGDTFDELTGLVSGALWRWNGSSWDEEIIGTLPGHTATFGLTTVHDMTPDGNFVVGYDRRSNPGDATGFVWTPATGIMSAADFMSDLGLEIPAGFVIRDLTAVSDDGRTIAGFFEQFTPPFGVRSFLIHLDATVGVPDVALSPAPYAPLRVFPNPMRHSATITLELSRSAPVWVRAYDAAGRMVRRLVDGSTMTAGSHLLNWDGRDESRTRVAPGVYFLEVQTSEQTQSKKVVVVD
jgi:hypothetical protein